VDDGALAAQLQREGVQSFAESWRELIERIASKSAALTQSQSGGAAP
jgi:transaldolase